MISEKQKKKLRAILEKISTPEEMKAFDLEILSDKNEKSKNEIIHEIEKNKTKIDFSSITNLMGSLERRMMEKIEGFQEEFRGKKYPIYNDEPIKKDIRILGEELKSEIDTDKKINKLSKDELVEIKTVLIELGKKLLEAKENKEKNEDNGKYSEALEGIAIKLNQLVAKSGSPDSVRLKDSNGNIIDPANSEVYEIAYGTNLLGSDNNYYTAYQLIGDTAWRIRQKTSLRAIGWASGTTDLATAWAAKESQSYNSTL